MAQHQAVQSAQRDLNLSRFFGKSGYAHRLANEEESAMSDTRDSQAVRVVELVVRDNGMMDETTVGKLAADLDAAEAANARAVVLVGSRPGYFIRHYTLDILLERAEAMSKQGVDFNAARPAPERPYHELLRRIESMPIAVIAAWLGHASAAFTLSVYAHGQDDALRAAASSFG